MQLQERVHVVNGLPPAADRYNSNPAGDVVSLANFSHFMALLSEGAGGTGTAEITVEACDNFTPSNTVEIPFKYRVRTTGDTWGALTQATADGVTPAAGANKDVQIFVEAADLPEGYPNVRVKLTEVVNDPCVAGLMYILSGPRYTKAIMETAIA